MTARTLGTAFPKQIPTFPPPAPPPPPNGATPDSNPSAPIVTNPLLQKIQPSGKTPTHPLTAQSPMKVESVPPVSPANAKQAERLLHDGIKLAKKEKLEPAFKIFQKAYQLDPNNEKIARSVGKVLLLANRPLDGWKVLSEFLARHPDSQIVRTMRASIGEVMLPEMEKALSSVPKDQQAQFAQIAQDVLLMTLTDQAVLTMSQAPQLRESFKELEGELSNAHAQPKDAKLSALAGLQTQAEQLFTLSNLPTLPPQEAEGIQRELKSLGTAILALAARFAKADSDPEIRAQAKIFEAYQALSEGKDEAALAAFDAARTEGCQVIGGGDAAKGLALLRGKYAAARKAAQEKKPEEIKKALEGVPAALLSVHEVLENVESRQLIPANLGLLKAWEERVDKENAAKLAEANKTWGKIVQAWDNLWRSPTSVDIIGKDTAAEKELIGKVRERLEKGESKTILEALQALAETGPENVKARAKQVHDQVKAGQFDDGTIKVGRLIRYASNTKPEDKVGGEILEEAANLAKQSSNASSATLYAVVNLISRNPDQVKRGAEGYNQQNEKIEKAKKPS